MQWNSLSRGQAQKPEAFYDLISMSPLSPKSETFIVDFVIVRFMPVFEDSALKLREVICSQPMYMHQTNPGLG